MFFEIFFSTRFFSPKAVFFLMKTLCKLLRVTLKNTVFRTSKNEKFISPDWERVRSSYFEDPKYWCVLQPDGMSSPNSNLPGSYGPNNILPKIRFIKEPWSNCQRHEIPWFLEQVATFLSCRKKYFQKLFFITF